MKKRSLNFDFIPRFESVKNYFKTDEFEDDLDYIIINLQMFDWDLEVPDLSKYNRPKRIAMKLKILRQSFMRMNALYGTIGAAGGGTVAGPHGAAFGAFLGSYIFGGVSLYSVFSRRSANQKEYAFN